MCLYLFNVVKHQGSHPCLFLSPHFDVLDRYQNRPKQPITKLILSYLGLQSRIVTKQVKACSNKFYGCFDLRVRFSKGHIVLSFFPTKTDSPVLKYPGLFIRLAVGHNMKWDHFESLARGRLHTQSRIKNTLLIRDLQQFPKWKCQQWKTINFFKLNAFLYANFLLYVIFRFFNCCRASAATEQQHNQVSR